MTQQHIQYSYILVSSKTGHNFDYVVHKLKAIREAARAQNQFKPKVFVLGNANVGKSSFINKLIQKANKFLKETERYSLYYRKGQRQVSDQFNMTTSSSNNTQTEQYSSHLTASPLPGTTIGITRVEVPSLGIKVTLPLTKQYV